MKLVAGYAGVAGYLTNEVVRSNHSAARHWYYGKTSEPGATPNGAAALFGNREKQWLTFPFMKSFSLNSIPTLKKSHEVEAGGCSNLPNASLNVNNYRC